MYKKSFLYSSSMLDPKRIRENPELVQENLEKRGDPSNLNLLKEAIIIDEKRRELIKKVESLKQKRNEITQKFLS
jgi:seryl-tRNA synthetase